MNPESTLQENNLVRQNRLLTEEIKRRVNELAALNTVAAAVSQSLDLDETLQTALEAVLNVIAVEAAGISLVDEVNNELVLRAQHGWNLDFVSEPMRIKLGDGLSGEVVNEDRVVITGDLTSDDRLAVPAFRDERVKALAMVPMHANGKVIGVLSVMNHEDYTFSNEEVDVLTAIADQVGMALDNARLYEEARRHEQLLGAIIHSAADAIIATDADCQLCLLNAAAYRLFDIADPAQAVGMRLDEAPLQPALQEALQYAMQRLEAKAASTFVDVTLNSGEPVTAVISRLQSPGVERGWVIVVRDVTHLRASEDTRMQFIETAAHDMRNPLSVTHSSLFMLKDYIDTSDPVVEEILQIAVDAINQMRGLLEDLLNMERIKQGNEFEFELCDPLALIERSLEETTPMFNSKNQAFTLDVPTGLPQIEAAPVWLQRAVVNYLSNASKYTPPHGNITLRARVQAPDLLVEVIDNGPGIPPEAQGRLFERFYRAPSAEENAGGSGLGLAIVKSIVEVHGGRVYACNGPQGGSVFGLTIPLVQQED